MVRRIIRSIGFIVFAIAFLLPAVKPLEAGSGPGSGAVKGWVCAVFAIMPSAVFAHPQALFSGKAAVEDFSLLFSGWINPLMLIYLVFSFWTRFVWVRRVLALVVVACIGCTWHFFAKASFAPLIGHYLWVAGIVLMLTPEVMGRRAAGSQSA